MFKDLTGENQKQKSGGSVERPPAQGISDSTAQEIALDDIKTSDTIIIKTRNSTYTFLVTDESERRGDLSGGPLEGRVLDVKLLNVDGNKLVVGSRAMFLVESGEGVKRVSTSTIAALSHQKGSSR